MRISDALAGMALLLFAAPACAADVTAAVPGHAGVTYEMLLKQAIPDLAADADGTWRSSNVPHLRDADGSPDSDTDLAFKDIEIATMKDAGRPRLLVLTGDSQTDSDFMSILAVFDATSPVPKLIDYVNVGGDRFSMISNPATLPISADTDAVIVDSNHFNSSQNYSIETLLYLDGGKLRVALSQFTLNQGLCGYEMRQNSSYTVRDDKGAKYRSIVVSVTQVTTHTGEECDDGTILPKAGKHTFTDVYRWDARRHAFATATHALAGLMGPDQ